MGQHVLVGYVAKPTAGHDYLRAAAHFAAATSAFVYYLGPEGADMKLAYPGALFDRGISDGRAM
eukprot:8215599-Alexandrium_andersonii.AAC.1